MAVVDHRSRAWPPGRVGVVFEMLAAWSRINSKALPPFDQRLPFGCQAFQLHGFHLGAILFTLRALLGQFVVVELALDPAGGAVEEVHGRPEQVFEVGVRGWVSDKATTRAVEDVGDAAGDDVAFGKRPAGRVRPGTGR